MPKLKVTLTKAEHDALAQELQALYTETNGTFRLDADFEDVSGLKSALEKERASRGTLEKTLSELRKQLGDADPAKARDALAKLQDLEDKKLIDEGKVEELLRQRTERLVNDYDAKLGERDTKLTAAEKRLAELVIDNELRAVATAKKVRPEAVEDFLRRGRDVYKLQDGKAVPFKADGTVQYGKRPNEPMSMDEWVDSIAPSAAHLFEGSAGGGAQHAGGGQRQGAAHTITREQAKDVAVYRAARVAAEKAGHTLTVVE